MWEKSSTHYFATKIPGILAEKIDRNVSVNSRTGGNRLTPSIYQKVQGNLKQCGPCTELQMTEQKRVKREDEFGTICVRAFALAVVRARQQPQTTHVPHSQPGMGNGGGRRVLQGSTGLAPLPLDSTPTQFFIAAILL